MKNGVIFQGFEWYAPSEGDHYDFLRDQVEHLSQVGITALWLPPAFKATSTMDPGYGIYDLYDLGEFDQKGSVRTKYGTKDQLHDLIQACHDHGIEPYADIVLNHKASADEEETFLAVPVAMDNRLHELSEPRDIRAWTKFTFPGRGDTYSAFKWNFNHFSGVDYDSLSGDTGVFKILGDNKDWAEGVSQEHGNFDYLMFADINHAHPDVRADLFNWASWFIETTGVRGFRFDALKHMERGFVHDMIGHIKSAYPDFYFVGEYWDYDPNALEQYLNDVEHQVDLFDVPLHNRLRSASINRSFDLRTIFDGTMVQSHPELAVTFVDNHDTQPGQSLVSFVDPWFKKIAYGLILLRKDGYPCIFFGDYYGLGEPEPMAGQADVIDNLLYIRKSYGHGEQVDYFEQPNLIGWTRSGTPDHPGSLAVVISTCDAASLRMSVGTDQAGKIYKDLTGSDPNEIQIGEDGFADFTVGPGDMTCWAEKQ